MALVRVTPPAPVVSLEQAKAHLRLSDDYDQMHVEALIEAATAWIDGADGWLGRALKPQVWDWTLDEFGEWRGRYWRDCIRVPLPPLIEVQSITYRDTAGDEQTLDPADYIVAGIGATGMIGPVNGGSWPSTYADHEAITVRFKAGYADGPEGDVPGARTTVPAPIRHAILLMVGHLYENREAVTDKRPDHLPLGVDALLSPYRVFA